MNNKTFDEGLSDVLGFDVNLLPPVGKVEIEEMERGDCHCGCRAYATKANRNGVALTDDELDALNDTDLSETGTGWFH